MPEPIMHQHVLRMLPEEDIGFARPAVRIRTASGQERTVTAWKFSAPEPELARRAGDPGYWTVTVWLPPGAEPVALVPSDDGPAL